MIKLDRRVTFYAPANNGPDALGTTENGWTERFTVWANVRYLRGSETVMADRADGKNPVIVTVRKSSQSDQILDSWRMDLGAEQFNVRERPRQSDDRQYYEFLAHSGVAV